MTSYSRLQTNVLAKFVDTICIFRDAGTAVAMGVFLGFMPLNKAPRPIQLNYEAL